MGVMLAFWVFPTLRVAQKADHFHDRKILEDSKSKQEPEQNYNMSKSGQKPHYDKSILEGESHGHVQMQKLTHTHTNSQTQRENMQIQASIQIYTRTDM